MSWHELFPLPLTGAAHTLPRTASAARNVPKFLDETTANATKMHAQTDPAATPKATRLLCRRILVNHLQLAAAAKTVSDVLGLLLHTLGVYCLDCKNQGLGRSHASRTQERIAAGCFLQKPASIVSCLPTVQSQK